MSELPVHDTPPEAEPLPTIEQTYNELREQVADALQQIGRSLSRVEAGDIADGIKKDITLINGGLSSGQQALGVLGASVLGDHVAPEPANRRAHSMTLEDFGVMYDGARSRLAQAADMDLGALRGTGSVADEVSAVVNIGAHKIGTEISEQQTAIETEETTPRQAILSHVGQLVEGVGMVRGKLHTASLYTEDSLGAAQNLPFAPPIVGGISSLIHELRMAEAGDQDALDRARSLIIGMQDSFMEVQHGMSGVESSQEEIARAISDVRQSLGQVRALLG